MRQTKPLQSPVLRKELRLIIPWALAQKMDKERLKRGMSMNAYIGNILQHLHEEPK